MITNNLTKVPAEIPAYRFGLHWNTIQAYLIPGIEDDIGAKFVNIIPAEAIRYRIRTGVECVFGILVIAIDAGGCIGPSRQNVHQEKRSAFLVKWTVGQS